MDHRFELACVDLLSLEVPPQMLLGQILLDLRFHLGHLDFNGMDEELHPLG
jgi:hypothetical protein